MQAGFPAGCGAAQKYNQPLSQMTLNTFKTAGMNEHKLMQGMNRIREIANVSKTKNKDKYMYVYLDPDVCPARMIKSLVSVYLNDILTCSVSKDGDLGLAKLYRHVSEQRVRAVQIHSGVPVESREDHGSGQGYQTRVLGAPSRVQDQDQVQVTLLDVLSSSQPRVDHPSEMSISASRRTTRRISTTTPFSPTQRRIAWLPGSVAHSYLHNESLSPASADHGRPNSGHGSVGVQPAKP